MDEVVLGGPVPRDQIIVVGPGRAELGPVAGHVRDVVGVEPVILGERDISRSPEMDQPEVTDEAAHVPVVAVGDIHIENALRCCSGEPVTFRGHESDVARDVHCFLHLHRFTPPTTAAICSNMNVLKSAVMSSRGQEENQHRGDGGLGFYDPSVVLVRGPVR